MSYIAESRFSGCLEIEQIRQRVTVRPTPIGNLAALTPTVAAETLVGVLRQIYLPTKFSLGFIHEMVTRADMHSRTLFASEREYVARLYNPPDAEVFPVCLAGLAGVGKSHTVAALQRALPAASEVRLDHFSEPIPLVSHWYASARGKAGGRQMLSDFLAGVEGNSRGSNTAKLLIECRRRAIRDGVSLLMLEETQHMNTGSGIALATNLLLTMTALGPPMVYVSNYSLLHKLLKRNSEDRQRLLSEPRIMLPDDPGSDDWLAYVAECVRVSNGQIKADPGELAIELYRSTYGLKRLVVHLLKLAYLESRNTKRGYINLADISQAYRSPEYWSYRQDVEDLNAIAVQRTSRAFRMDLRCPIPLPVAQKSSVVQFCSQERDERVNAKLIDSSMNPGEREAIKQIEPESRTLPKIGKAPRSKPSPKATHEEKLSAFSKYVEKVNRDKPKHPR